MRSSSIFLFIGILASIAKAHLPFGHNTPESAELFLNGFHFLSGNGSAEISANHHCVLLSDDFLQCVIYTTKTTPAHLAGIEYIISSALFETLDWEERQLWHSHAYEVSSGSLIEPGLPTVIDNPIMEVLIGTYGKTVHTWRFDEQENPIPVGVPELVMGYTEDGQLLQSFVETRDELFEVNTESIREARMNISVPDVIPGADSWKYGFVLTYGIVNTTMETVFPANS